MTLTNKQRLFREEAFARRGKTEPLNGLLRVTAPHEWILLVCLGIAMLGFVAWGLFGSIEESVSARCVLAQAGDRFVVNAESSGTVVELLVGVGDRVEAGQPIARLRIPELGREISIARSRVEILESTDAKPPDALDAARAELIELEALEAAGKFLATPFAGVIAAVSLSLGQAVAAGATVASVRVDAGNELEAIAMVLPENARRLAVGMEAQVLALAQNQEGADALEAEVSYVSAQAVTPPHWLAALGLPALPRGHMVSLTLNERISSSMADGYPCEMRIILRKVSPARLLISLGTN